MVDNENLMNKVLVPGLKVDVLAKSPDKKAKVNELYLNTIENPNYAREMPDSSEQMEK